MINAPHPLAIDHVSAGADPFHNEDMVAVFEHEGVTDILVLDGATSVAERDYVDAAAGDVVWFVTQFCRHLEPQLRRGRSQADSVKAALADLRRDFLERTGRGDVPLHAWPIAAMSWLRIVATGPAHVLHAYCVGDCKTLLYREGSAVLDLDPYVNPQEGILQAEIERLTQAGVDATARKAHLLPMLRARREQQNTMAAPAILCLDPRGELAARTFALALDPGTAVLGMTDGFYRIVDPYQLQSADAMARRCVAEGVAAVLADLRHFEADRQRADSGAVKRADDASAVVCMVLN